MAYVQTEWIAGTTPLSEANMDHLETQYDEAMTTLAATKLDDMATPDDNTDLNSTTTEHGLLKKLDNIATNFMNGQGNWAGAAALTVAETQVFSGTSPTSWTDLDLSGTTGSQVTLVVLKVYSATAIRTFIFRPNGDTDEHYDTGNRGANTFYAAGATTFGLVIVTTDASGIVEWNSSNATTVTVDIITYIK